MKPVLKKVFIAFLVAAVVVVGLGVAGFVYLRNSDWWVAFTLFSDDTRVENFRSFHTLFPADDLAAGTDHWEFSVAPRSLPETFRFQGEDRSVAAFLDETWTTGLAIAVDGELLAEDYYRGYSPESSITSFSMAKSVVSALVGIAIERGYIGSVEDRVDAYLPAFEGTAYGAVSVHDLLTMSSGMGFDEDYDSFTSDINMLPIRVFGFQDALPDLVLETPKIREAGLYNEYISSDTIVLGLVLEQAVGRSLSRFLEEGIWQPAGMEFPASWNTDVHGNTLGHAFLSASLRDFLRFGRLYLNQGARDDTQIIPADWVMRSVNPGESHLQPGDNPDSHWTFGYGYKWWIPEHPQGDFVAIGIWGQYIYVHPGYDVVIAKTGADYYFDERDHETIAMFRDLARWAAEGR